MEPTLKGTAATAVMGLQRVACPVKYAITRNTAQTPYGAPVRHHIRLKRPCLKKMKGRKPITARFIRYKKSVASFMLVPLRASPLDGTAWPGRSGAATPAL